jgi:hypothetical protein
MFSNAIKKLEDAHFIFDYLKKAGDAPSFRALFNSFLNAARAITNALQKEGSRIKGFEDWYKIKQKEMKDDELLRFVHEARTEDFHEGRHRIIFSSNMQPTSYFMQMQFDSLNAKLDICAEGVFWIVNEGTAMERRIPITYGVQGKIRVSLINGPSTHKGKELAEGGPITICQLALDYLSQVVHEAKMKFDKNR